MNKTHSVKYKNITQMNCKMVPYVILYEKNSLSMTVFVHSRIEMTKYL